MGGIVLIFALGCLVGALFTLMIQGMSEFEDYDEDYQGGPGDVEQW